MKLVFFTLVYLFKIILFIKLVDFKNHPTLKRTLVLFIFEKNCLKYYIVNLDVDLLFTIVVTVKLFKYFVLLKTYFYIC